MIPTEHPSERRRRKGLRRWAPYIAAGVSVAVVAALLVTRPSTSEHNDAEPTVDLVGALGDGAITYARAQDEHLDVTFMDTCDTATGNVAMPYFTQACYANVADNGGATAPGVTADTIKIVVYLPPEDDPVMDFITAALKSDDTTEQVKATYLGYTDMFNAMFQTYGRKVELEFLQGSGPSTDEVAARADAVKAVEEMGAFAVWGSPALTSAWSEEIASRGLLCLGCGATTPTSPNVFSLLPSAEQGQLHLAEYMKKKLDGKPAGHAGDESMRDRIRRFGYLYLETGERSNDLASDFKQRVEDADGSLETMVPYTLDPARLQEQATSIIAQLKDAGVTTVVFQGDPVALTTFTPEATEQGYSPEWLIAPSAFVDVAAFGRTYDQTQWAHAFGLSSLAARVSPDARGSLYEWYFGEPPPANDSEGTIAPQPELFFAGLQAAGPALTTDTMRTAIYGGEPAEGRITGLSFSYGDHGLWPDLEPPDQAGIDDFTEVWWDAEATGPDELGRDGKGMYRYVDGGRRYFLGRWTSEDRAFEEQGSVLIYDEIPPSDAAPGQDYRSPRKP